MMAAHDISRAPRAGLSSLQQKARNIEAAGYALIPMGSNGNPQPYAKGQKYPASMVSRDAERFGVRLDGAILLDYDGNKASPMPISELFELLMGEPITEQEALSEAVQWRFKGGDLDGSYHWLFRLPEGVDASSLRQCVTGVFEGVDIKTGNQLIFIKADKDLADDTLPPISELLEAPTALLELLKQTAPVRTEFAPFAPTGETTRYGAAALAGALEAVANAPQGHRNETLNTEGLKVAQLVAGGEIAAQDAAELERAALAAGMGQSEITATLASATAAGMTMPRNAPPKKINQQNNTNSQPQPQPLDRPLDDPADIYHPEQIDRKKHRETQEWVFHKAKGTAENLSRLVKAYGVRIRYNELSRDVEISVNGNLPSGDLARNVSLSLVEDLCRINEYPYTAAASHLDRLADMDAYNPAMEWVKSRQWDGEDRIRALYNCLTLADETKGEISWTLFRKWMLGAMAILCGKARKFEHVLVLVDQMGGIGKTRFFNTLSPKEYQADGVTLNPDDKDSVLQVASKWLVELGEIGATFGKSDIEILKAFLSRDTDELRPAYAKAANRYQRRTAFFGSVNSLQFLSDDTNNRRFWPIHVAGVNYQHTIDMQQVWAEALARIERGETWHLDQDENRAIGEHNEAFRSKDRVEEMIVQKYDPSATLCRYMTASEVLAEVGVMNPKQTDTRKASALLRKMFEHKTSRGLTVFHMPAMKIYRTAPSLVWAS